MKECEEFGNVLVKVFKATNDELEPCQGEAHWHICIFVKIIF